MSGSRRVLLEAVGRVLEPAGDRRPRWMVAPSLTVKDRIRLIRPLQRRFSAKPPAGYVGLPGLICVINEPREALHASVRGRHGTRPLAQYVDPTVAVRSIRNAANTFLQTSSRRPSSFALDHDLRLEEDPFDRSGLVYTCPAARTRTERRVGPKIFHGLGEVLDDVGTVELLVIDEHFA